MKFIKVTREAGLIACIRKENIESIYKTKTGSWILYHISKNSLQSDAFTIDASVNIDDLLKEISGDEPAPKKVKLRPMSEAPLDKEILLYISLDQVYMGKLEESFGDYDDGKGGYVGTALIEKTWECESSYAESMEQDARKYFIGWTDLPEVEE